MVRAIPDHLADAVVEVDTRRKAQIDACCPQLGGQQPPALPRELTPRLGIEVVSVTDGALWRQLGEPAAKALHATAFVIDRDEQRRDAQRTDLLDERGELIRVA